MVFISFLYNNQTIHFVTLLYFFYLEQIVASDLYFIILTNFYTGFKILIRQSENFTIYRETPFYQDTFSLRS